MTPPARPRPPAPPLAPPFAVGRLLAWLAAAALLGGCSTMHVQRAAYQMLRQGDCRLNQLDEICHRNFAAEFHAYDRMRRDFILEHDRSTRLEGDVLQLR